MEAFVLPKPTIDVIRRIHSKLEDGEKLLLVGLGTITQRPLLRLLAFAAFASMVIFAPLIFILILPLALHNFGFILLGIIVILSVACGMSTANNNHPRWHALTSNRLLRLDDGGVVQTIANRADVERIQASETQVRLLVKKSDEKALEIKIAQVRGLPAVVGGDDLVLIEIGTAA